MPTNLDAAIMELQRKAMNLHRGRLIDHVQIRVSDLAASQKFYEAVLCALGLEAHCDDNHLEADELWIDQGDTPSRIHLAFQASDRDTVRKAYEAGIAAGGRDNGAPGERDYHPGYFAAFLLDPDCNNIEVVHHGPVNRTAESVEITF